DEVTVGIFSFLSHKRVCRLMCVHWGWGEILGGHRVWRPLFEARWPLRLVEDGSELVGEALSACASTVQTRKGQKTARRYVLHWGLEEEINSSPKWSWMTLYRDRHKAEARARGRLSAKGFCWRPCCMLGCTMVIKSAWAAERHMKTHKKPAQPK
ncbi:unnamed protein product, partial [Discosporangium mesarthrocarpum]